MGNKGNKGNKVEDAKISVTKECESEKMEDKYEEGIIKGAE